VDGGVVVVKQFSDFQKEYEDLQLMVREYEQSFEYGSTASKQREQTDRAGMLSQLEDIERSDASERLQVMQDIEQKLNRLHNLIFAIDAHERNITEEGFVRLRERSRFSDAPAQTGIPCTQEDIAAQVEETVKSIEKITKSRVPQSLARLCGFVNPLFRRNAYKRIVRNRKKLEEMVLASERELQVIKRGLMEEIDQHTAAKINELKEHGTTLETARAEASADYYNKLRLLLLNGLEEIFCSDTMYKTAADDIDKYNKLYISGAEDGVSAGGLFVGIQSQAIQARDDGTLDSYMRAIVQNGTYENGSLLQPVVLDKYFGRQICALFRHSNSNPTYSLFSNYAVQMMNCFADETVTTYLVDCTNAGGKFAGFSAGESGEPDSRINIVRSQDKLRELLSDTAQYIIETSSTYLRNTYQNIQEYNASASVKRGLRVLVISDISEISGSDMLEWLLTVIRNGCRCGVFVFLGIPENEYVGEQMMNSARAAAVRSIIELCDCISFDNSGMMTMTATGARLLAPPKMNSLIEQRIIEGAARAEGAAVIALRENFIAPERYFTGDCTNGISIPIGVDMLGNEYSIYLNLESAYVLIGGNPGYGKSSLLHNIILQCICRYAPEDLELYVADLKDGCEFDVYAACGVKSLKVVLDDPESDIAASFLNYINSLVNSRLEMFRTLSEISGEMVRNIEQFYTVNNERRLVPHMPRIILIIDEFQSLFNGSRITGEITNMLVRMCRTVGISIIMASQRVQADTTAVSNSFGQQTKDYFIYRMLFRLPYTGAREIVSERCSDTNRENTAIRKAQTLRKGQVIVNSNMGATESENRLVQCYYPDNEMIEAVCRQVVSRQGALHGIILNSENKPVFRPSAVTVGQEIVFGESNRLHYDRCNSNSDVFRDDTLVSLDAGRVNRLLTAGSDKRVFTSVFWCTAAKLSCLHKSELRINILSKKDISGTLFGAGRNPQGVRITDSASEFMEYSKEQLGKGHFVLSVVFEPYDFDSLTQDSYSPPSGHAAELLEMLGSDRSFTLFFAENMKKVKENCAYCEEHMPCRITSVGNIAGIRSVMSYDAAEKIADSDFHIIRPGVIKAYYYNKSTDKLGRMRLFEASDIMRLAGGSPSAPAGASGAANASGQVQSQTGANEYSGLHGN